MPAIPVGFCYGSDEAGARETVDAPSRPTAARRVAVQADVTDADAVDAAFAEVESRARPGHVLVNNAGINRDGLLVRMTDEQWQAVLDTNLTGAFHTIRRATPAMMKARYGRIVNVSSVGGHIGTAGPGQLRRGQGRPRRPHPQRRPGAGAPATSPATWSRPDLSSPR